MSCSDKPIGDFAFTASQKRIGRFFESYRRRNRRLAAIAFFLLALHTCCQCSVSWFDFVGKAQIRQSIFMRAIDLRVVGQGGKFCQRPKHLLRRSFEQASATAGKQRIPAKQPVLVRCEIGNMPACMSGHIEHRQLERQSGRRQLVAFPDRIRNLRNRFLTRAKYRYIKVPQQFRYTADMVSMVMCQ